jgi:hypothetical protein
VEDELPAADTGAEDLELVSRLVLGLLLFGSEELVSRLRIVQQRLEAAGQLAGGDAIPDDETMTDVLAYLTVGMMMRGGKLMSRAVKWSFHRSMNTATWALSTFGRVTDNFIARPFRDPIERRMWALIGEGQAAITDGRREVYASRKLANEVIDEVIDEVIQTLAESPELTSGIERVLVGQGSSLGGTAVGGARQVSTSADDLAEGIVRRLLRRKPRHELPPSPLAGQPLKMYEPWKPAEEAQDDSA